MQLTRLHYAPMLTGYAGALWSKLPNERKDMKTLCLFSLLFLTASVLSAPGQTQGVLSVLPGATVQVSTAADLPQGSIITLTLTPTGKLSSTNASTASAAGNGPGTSPPPPCDEIEVPAIENPGTRSFSFSIPPDACTGTYVVSASASAGNTTQTPANVTSPQNVKAGNATPLPVNITSPQNIKVQPQVTGVDPKTFFRGGTRTLTFLGPPTLKNVLGYSIQFAGHALPACITTEDPLKAEVSCVRSGESSNGQIAFILAGKNFFTEFEGKQTLLLVRNGAESVGQEIHVVNAVRNMPRNYAIGFTAALVLLIYVLLSTRAKTMRSNGGTGPNLLTALFLDEETQTYSLSKCQFYAWTAAATLGYIFLFISKSAVQGSLVFPDIPEGLPGIILYSAGTSVLATGITSTKGSKGAGEVHPTLADFITSGGVVAPERLQFVVWTIIGVFTFLSIVFKSDPMMLSDLPRIPDGFMNLMGISSAAYLAGKLARKAGPVIKGIKVDSVTGTGDQMVLKVQLTGENLDPNGKIRIDGNPIRDSLAKIEGTPDPQTKFCTALAVTVSEAGAYVVGAHTLTLVNTDAQAADVTFPANPLTIDDVSGLPTAPGLDPAKVLVKGANFSSGLTFAWLDGEGKPLMDANGQPLTDSTGNAEYLTETTINVTRPGIVIRGFVLELTSQLHLKARKKI